jgi:hypothetical protein
MDRALTGGDGCVAVSMARASTDVLSIAAWAATRLPLLRVCHSPGTAIVFDRCRWEEEWLRLF